MIISRTPFRVSFMGGGTDLPEFYREEEGAVLSTTINKFMYITINDRFDSSYRLSYSRTEIADSLQQIEHPIFKNVLGKYGVPGKGLEIISMADIPAGTGLGSSSSFTVGLLHAVKAHLGKFQSAEDLAAEASRIEIEDLGEPIGKQDQYAAAYGGLQIIRFLPSGQVVTEPLILKDSVRQNLESSMMMFYTGTVRKAAEVLAEQRSRTESKREVLRQMRNQAFTMRDLLQSDSGVEDTGRLLHEAWNLKKSLVASISNPEINEAYDIAMKNGAWGGKLLGAGGGGFLLMLAPAAVQPKIASALSGYRRIPIQFEKLGSRIIFVG
ncbi:MAG: hypothetical protein K2X47_02020 [Bdellovibrionales bacterium]|nr:hypothetical protein [Bdellovibrionales bacterium]